MIKEQSFNDGSMAAMAEQRRMWTTAMTIQVWGSTCSRLGLVQDEPASATPRASARREEMSSTTDFATGFLEGGIHDFLVGITRPAAGMSYALITCLDSCRQLSKHLDTSEPLVKIKERCTILGDGLLLPTSDLLDAVRKRRIFFGFDEIWFLNRRKIEPKPRNLILVGLERVSESVLRRHRQWLVHSGCSLGLGDGSGLNFVVKARGTAKLFLETLSESTHAQAG